MTLRQDIIIQQYASWQFVYTHRDTSGNPVDLTGWSAAASIKIQIGQTAVPRAYLSSGPDANGGIITLGGAAGTVTMSMTPSQTKLLVWDFDLWAMLETGIRAIIRREVPLYWDLLLTDTNGNAYRALEGRALIRRSVTP